VKEKSEANKERKIWRRKESESKWKRETNRKEEDSRFKKYEHSHTVARIS